MVNGQLLYEICFPYNLTPIARISECSAYDMTCHGTLKGFIQAKWVGINEPEIPILALPSFLSLLRGEYIIEGADIISIPLICDQDFGKRMHSTAILHNTFYTSANTPYKLSYILPANKPYKYFSGRGILIKEEGGVNTLLLLHTASMVPDPTNHFCLHHYNLRISPSVFINKDIVSKYISSKLIPALCNYSPSTGNKSPTIIIEDLSRWLLTPIRPNLITHEQDLKDFYAREDTINEIIDSL